MDRGKFSLETVCVLFALKCQYPARVFLIRGNHEDAGINQHMGFYDECVSRMGAVNGAARHCRHSPPPLAPSPPPRGPALRCVLVCTHETFTKAGPFSVARLKMGLAFHDRLAYSRVHRRSASLSAADVWQDGDGLGLLLFRDHVHCLASVSAWSAPGNALRPALCGWLWPRTELILPDSDILGCLVCTDKRGCRRLLRRVGISPEWFCAATADQEIDSSAVVLDKADPLAWRGSSARSSARLLLQ